MDTQTALPPDPPARVTLALGLTARPFAVVIALGAVMALQTTSFAVILPLLSRRLTGMGAGVDALSLSIIAFAVAATLSAPLMGALADRYGRRPLVLGPLLIYMLAFAGYGLAPTAAIFIALRGIAGALTAGLTPAATGIVADLAPPQRRAQWIGILIGGMSAGWMVGPTLGGLLYDRWGVTVPFAVSVGLAGLTLLIALALVPETRPLTPRAASASPVRIASPLAGLAALRGALPRPHTVSVLLLGISFITMFSWAFIDPQLMFYAYDELGWSSSQLGLVLSSFGITSTAGQLFLGHASDRLGRKPVVLVGLLLFAAQFVGLALTTSVALIVVGCTLGGLGSGLLETALVAYLLDLTPPDRKARVMGLRGTAASLGNLLGPALVILVTPAVSPRGVFGISAVLVATMALVGLGVLRGR